MSARHKRVRRTSSIVTNRYAAMSLSLSAMLGVGVASGVPAFAAAPTAAPAEKPPANQQAPLNFSKFVEALEKGAGEVIGKKLEQLWNERPGVVSRGTTVGVDIKAPNKYEFTKPGFGGGKAYYGELIRQAVEMAGKGGEYMGEVISSMKIQTLIGQLNEAKANSLKSEDAKNIIDDLRQGKEPENSLSLVQAGQVMKSMEDGHRLPGVTDRDMRNFAGYVNSQAQARMLDFLQAVKGAKDYFASHSGVDKGDFSVLLDAWTHGSQQDRKEAIKTAQTLYPGMDLRGDRSASATSEEKRSAGEGPSSGEAKASAGDGHSVAAEDQRKSADERKAADERKSKDRGSGSFDPRDANHDGRVDDRDRTDLSDLNRDRTDLSDRNRDRTDLSDLNRDRTDLSDRSKGRTDDNRERERERDRDRERERERDNRDFGHVE